MRVLILHFQNKLILKMKSKYIGEDSQNKPQSGTPAFQRHQTKDRWGTNNDKTNATYETTDAQAKKNSNRGTMECQTKSHGMPNPIFREKQ